MPGIYDVYHRHQLDEDVERRDDHLALGAAGVIVFGEAVSVGLFRLSDVLHVLFVEHHLVARTSAVRKFNAYNLDT